MKDIDMNDGTIRNIFYLAHCVMMNEQPDVCKIKEYDWEAIYKMACFHSVEALIFYSISLCGIDIPIKAKATGDDVKIISKTLGIDESLLSEWKQRKKMAFLKNAQLDSGRNELFAAMEQAGCWHVPLKGIVLKSMYPSTGMRQMNDNDILFDEKYRQWVKEWFEANGYETVLYGKRYDDCYLKLPYRYYEMHISLVNLEDEFLRTYYKDIKDRLVKVENTKFELAFTDEDFYVYLLVHAHKHYSYAGTGIRIIFDCFVFFKEKMDSLDWEYIEKEVKKLKIDEFERTMRSLVQKYIADVDGWIEALTESETKMLNYLIGAGTYGNNSYRIDNGVKKNSGGGVRMTGKIKYLFSRAFMPPEYMYERYAFSRKHKWLLPVAYVMRIFKGMKQKRIFNEVKQVANMKDEE